MEEKRHQRRSVSQAQLAGSYLFWTSLPSSINQREGVEWKMGESQEWGASYSSEWRPHLQNETGSSSTWRHPSTTRPSASDLHSIRKLCLWAGKAGFKSDSGPTNAELLGLSHGLLHSVLTKFFINVFKEIQKSLAKSIQLVKGGAFMQNQVSWLNSVLLLSHLWDTGHSRKIHLSSKTT